MTAVAIVMLLVGGLAALTMIKEDEPVGAVVLLILTFLFAAGTSGALGPGQ